jgi:hypothetical protein
VTIKKLLSARSAARVVNRNRESRRFPSENLARTIFSVMEFVDPTLGCIEPEYWSKFLCQRQSHEQSNASEPNDGKPTLAHNTLPFIVTISGPLLGRFATNSAGPDDRRLLRRR